VQVLEAALERYAEHYDRAPFGYVTIDGTGIIRELNRAACTLLGMERPKALGTPLRSFVSTSDRPALSRHLDECGSHGAATTRMRLERPGRPAVLVELSSRRGAGDHPDSYAVAIRELTQRDSERDELKEIAGEGMARGAAKVDLLAMISHELRNPLTPLLTAVSALEQRAGDSADIRNLCQIIRRNVNTEVQLIGDLLDATRISRGKMALRPMPLEIDAVVRDAVDQAAASIEAKMLQVALVLEARGALVEGDPLRLGQVFANLIGNAVKFTPPGGELALRSWRAGETVAVEITDSGSGFAEAALPRLFEPFEQGDRPPGSQGGLGLGLAISKGIVELHHGRISAASAGPGKGSRFVVELPVLRPTRSPASNGRRRARILIVEDNADTAEALALALGATGYQVNHAASMALALQVDLTAIDLVVSDLRLSDGDGRSLLQQLRARGPVTAIALSGYGADGDLETSKAAGFFAHLIKPVDLEVLTATIERALADKSQP
jgi:PAS domain S-box-containing protein